jgi:hypothetical protein
MRCLVCTQVRRAAERGGLDRSPLLYRLVSRYSIRPAAARRDGATDQRTRPRFLRFADGDARRKKMLRHTNAVLAQLPADQFTSRQASATDRDSPMERSGGPLDDTLRVQCVERFLCHFAGDAQKVLAPTNPLASRISCAARMYGSSPHQPIRLSPRFPIAGRRCNEADYRMAQGGIPQRDANTHSRAYRTAAQVIGRHTRLVRSHDRSRSTFSSSAASRTHCPRDPCPTPRRSSCAAATGAVGR